jgi:hypothetical protein
VVDLLIIEGIMRTIALIGVAFVVVPVTCLVVYVRHIDGVYKYACTRHVLVVAAEALKSYHAQHDVFPAEPSAYIEQCRIPIHDQWGGSVVFDVSEREFALTSLGSDRRSGGRGSGTDLIVSWKVGHDRLVISAAAICP